MRGGETACVSSGAEAPERGKPMARDGKQSGSLSQAPLDRLSNFNALADKWGAKSRELAVIDPVEHQ